MGEKIFFFIFGEPKEGLCSCKATTYTETRDLGWTHSYEVTYSYLGYSYVCPRCYKRGRRERHSVRTEGL